MRNAHCVTGFHMNIIGLFNLQVFFSSQINVRGIIRGITLNEQAILKVDQQER